MLFTLSTRLSISFNNKDGGMKDVSFTGTEASIGSNNVSLET